MQPVGKLAAVATSRAETCTAFVILTRALTHRVARRGHAGADPPSASHCRSVSVSLCAARLAAVGESRARLTAVQDRFGIFAPAGVCQCAIATPICQPSTGPRCAGGLSPISVKHRAAREDSPAAVAYPGVC